MEHKMDTLSNQMNFNLVKMRALMESLPDGSDIVDFEESMHMENAQKTLRLWMKEDHLIAFAYVDNFDNLCFEYDPHHFSQTLETEIFQWGVDCQKSRNLSDLTLDYCCQANHQQRIDMLRRNGFLEQSIRTLHYSRTLSAKDQTQVLAEHWKIRLFHADDDMQNWILLHQAAFDSDQMSIEYRQAIMSGPEYRADMDWVIEMPDQTLAAFCLGNIDLKDSTIGYLDPIGVHPLFVGKGFGTSLLATGFNCLFNAGVTQVKLGTSSENLPMQKLAEKMGFAIESESVWFSRKIS